MISHKASQPTFHAHGVSALSWGVVLPLCLATLLIGIVFPQGLLAQSPASLHARIDELVTGAHIGPAAPIATDAEFARRVYLDLTGMVPSSAELAPFLADASADKRTRLVDQLLASPRYARHWANVFDVMWMERRPDKHVPAPEWQKYLFDSFVANKPYDVLVREVLTADGVDPATRPAAKFFLDRDAEPNLLTRDVGRIFFGRDFQCNQCHDHPLIEDYLQPDYYGIFAFLNRLETFTGADKKTVLMEKADGEVSFQSVFDPTAKGITWPRVPGGKQVEEPKFNPGEEYAVAPAKDTRHIPKYSRRAQLAQQTTTGTNQPFARNIANRLWAQMMGRGLVEPLDMHSVGNPPTNPQLLELLTAEFAAGKFDIRAFIRELALTQTYQRSIDVPADIVAQVPALAGRAAELDAQQKALAAAAEQAKLAQTQVLGELSAARKVLPAVTEQRTTAAAPLPEIQKAIEAASKALTDANAQYAPKADILQALAATATKAKEAVAKLPGEADLADAAAKFQARADQVNVEVAALALVVQQKTAEAKVQTDKLAAIQTQLAEIDGRMDVSRKQIISLEEQHDAAAAKYRLDVAVAKSAERKLAELKLAQDYATLASAAAAAQASLDKLTAEIAGGKAKVAQLAAELPALQTALTAAQKTNDEAAAALTAAQQTFAAGQGAMKEFAEVLAKAEAASSKLPQDAELATATQKLKTRSEQITAEVVEAQKLVAARDVAAQAAAAQLASATQAMTTNTTESAALTQQLPALEAQLPAAAEKAKAEAVAFARLSEEIPDRYALQYAIRPLRQVSPEQFGWSVLQVTGVYHNYVLATAAELNTAKPLPDADKADPAKLAQRQQELEAGVHAKLAPSTAAFVGLFANSPGAAQTDFFATVDQALFLANGGVVKGWLAPSGENLTARLLALPDNGALANELYLSILCRQPTAAESNEVNQYLTARPNDKPVAVQELAWALISSTEFRFNH